MGKPIGEKQMKQIERVDLSRPVIFYGAGQLACCIAGSLSEMGIEPVCFADRDENKHWSVINGKEVLPLADAVERFPDFLLYITLSPASWNKVEKELIDSGLVGEDRILNRKVGAKYRSCYALENELTTYNTMLFPCCHPYPRKPYVSFDFTDYEGTVERYLAQRNTVIDAINDGIPCDFCKACPMLMEQYWLRDRKIRILNISDRGVCGFNCIYCSNINKNNKMSDEPIPDFALLLSILEQKRLIDDNLLIKVGPDEITAHPKCDEILDACKKYAVEIFTNAAIYKSKIRTLLENKNPSLLVSMDAGTKETFARIKGRDVYGEVCENLRRYAFKGGSIRLKYILLPGINDNKKDANGFLKLCLEINAVGVMISRNRTDIGRGRALPEKTVEIAKYIREKAEEMGIAVSFVDVFLGLNEVKRIEHSETR